MISNIPLFIVSLNCPLNQGDLMLKIALNDLLIKKGEIVGVKCNNSIPDIHTKGIVEVHSRIDLIFLIFRRLILNYPQSANIYILLSPGGMLLKKSNTLLSIIRITIYKFLNLIGIKIVHLGISTESDQGTKVGILKKIENTMKLCIGYRDSLSLAEAKERNENNAFYFPDLSFEFASKLDHFRNPNGTCDRRGCLITVRKILITSELAYETLVDNVIDRFVESGYPEIISFFYQVDVDKEYQQNLAKKHDKQLLQKEKFPYDFEHLFQVYSSHKFIVSNRLHALLLGAFCGCIPIPIVTSKENKKIIGMFNDGGLGHLIYDLENSNVELHEHMISINEKYQNSKLIEQWIESSSDKINHEINKIFSSDAS